MAQFRTEKCHSLDVVASTRRHSQGIQHGTPQGQRINLQRLTTFNKNHRKNLWENGGFP
jgi:hypothetical protein